MEGAFSLDTVVGKGMTVSESFMGEDQALWLMRDALILLSFNVHCIEVELNADAVAGGVLGVSSPISIDQTPNKPMRE